MTVQINVTVNPRDIARLEKRLSKWQGKDLATRMDKALQAGLKLFVPALKARAARHNRTGKTMATYGVRKLRKQPFNKEVAAYKVGASTWYRHFAIVGTSRGVEPDPYVASVEEALSGTVTDFVGEQITRLA